MSALSLHIESTDSMIGKIATIPNLQKKGLDSAAAKMEWLYPHKVAQQLNSVGELYLTMTKKKKEENGKTDFSTMTCFSTTGY